MIRSFLVYSRGAETTGPELLPPAGVEIEIACQSNLERFFIEHAHYKLFQGFLDERHVGLVLHDGQQWLSYAWMANPRSPVPPHLPQWVRTLSPYWIFFCHTRESFRGRGLYKAALDFLCRRALEGRLSGSNRAEEVLIDTEASNRASRKGIIATGFKERGVLICHYLRLPSFSRVFKWHWHEYAGNNQNY
jgi:GNAT superfamily N-acetyltransferase